MVEDTGSFGNMKTDMRPHQTCMVDVPALILAPWFGLVKDSTFFFYELCSAPNFG
jgi:hypothetical protein